MLHRARAGAAGFERWPFAYVVAAAVLLVSPLAMLTGLLASVLTFAAFHGQGTSSFLAGVRETLNLSDVGIGAATTVAYAVVAAVVLARVAPKIGRGQLHLVLKLAIAFGALFLAHLVEGVVLRACLGDRSLTATSGAARQNDRS